MMGPSQAPDPAARRARPRWRATAPGDQSGRGRVDRADRTQSIRARPRRTGQSAGESVYQPHPKGRAPSRRPNPPTNRPAPRAAPTTGACGGSEIAKGPHSALGAHRVPAAPGARPGRPGRGVWPGFPRLLTLLLALASLPIAAASLLDQARAARQSGDLTQARSQVKAHLSAEPSDVQARLLLGQIELDRAEPALAEEALRRAAELGAPPGT